MYLLALAWINERAAALDARRTLLHCSPGSQNTVCFWRKWIPRLRSLPAVGKDRRCNEPETRRTAWRSSPLLLQSPNLLALQSPRARQEQLGVSDNIAWPASLKFFLEGNFARLKNKNMGRRSRRTSFTIALGHIAILESGILHSKSSRRVYTISFA